MLQTIFVTVWLFIIVVLLYIGFNYDNQEAFYTGILFLLFIILVIWGMYTRYAEIEISFY